jgi:hypothetical protein
LHFPIPRTPIVDFEREVYIPSRLPVRRRLPHPRPQEITLTNYTGTAREYLKLLLELAGARFTASMSGKNTVVIAAFRAGTKTDKARNWHIPVVHHGWLEVRRPPTRAPRPSSR